MRIAPLLLVALAAACIQNEVTPTPAGTGDDTGAAASEGIQVDPDTDAHTPPDTDLPTFDPEAPITLADLPGTYTSAPMATHTLIYDFEDDYPFQHPCRGEVTLVVSPTGAVHGSGTCTIMPHVTYPVLPDFMPDQQIEIRAQVRTDPPHFLDASQSTIRVFDDGRTDTIPLIGGFQRNANHGRPTLRLYHARHFGPEDRYSFESVQERIYPWVSAATE